MEGLEVYILKDANGQWFVNLGVFNDYDEAMFVAENYCYGMDPIAERITYVAESSERN